MADLEKIVKLIFEGDGTGLSREMKLVSRDFDNFSRDVQNATAPLGDFGVKVAKAEAALIALGAAGLVYAFNKAKEFEAGAIELDKVLSDEEGLAGGLDTAKQKAIEFSDTYGESSSNILSSIAEFRQANFTLAESIGLTEEAMRLKIAGDLEAAESSQFLKQILSGFAAEASDAGTVIDQLNAVSNNYNSNVRELAVGLGDLSGVSDTVNMSYAETIGVLTPVIEVFGSGSEAARALRTGLIRMVDDTPAITSAMESIGVSQYEANGELKNAYEILGDVAKAFETTDESQQLFIAGQIFGKEQAAKMVQVIRDWDNVLEITETALNGVGSAQIEVDKRLQSSQVAVDRFVVGWENLNAAIGGKFAESANGTINGLTDIENALRESLGDETFDVIWDALNSFFADTETLLKQVAQNLPEALAGVDFSALVESFQGLGAEISEALDALFGGDLDLSTVQGLEDAIQKVVDIATKMTEFTTGFIEGLNPLLTAIGEITEGITDMDSEGTELAGNAAGWAKDINTLFSSLDLLKGVITGIAGIIGLSSVANSLLLFASIKPESFAAISTKISGMAGNISQLIGAAAGLVGAGAIGWEIGTWLNSFDVVSETAEGFAAWTDQLVNWSGNADAVNDSGQEMAQTIREIREEALRGALLEVGVELTGQETLEDLQEKYNNLQNPEPIEIEVDAERAGQTLDDMGLSAEKLREIELGFNSESVNEFNRQTEDKQFEVVGHYENGEEILMEINQSVPAEKEVEVKLSVSEQAKIDLERDLAAIEATAENLQTAMEWSAKVDIAEIEAAADTATSAFESVSQSIGSSADAVADMYSAFVSGADDLSMSDKWFAMDQLQEELEMQAKLVDSQVELNAAQAEYMRLRNEQIENGGESVIKIDTNGLEPILDMLFWEIIQKVQIQANENLQEFLKGIPA